MPEGPSIVILREATEAFVGKRVLRASGNTQVVEPERMIGRTVRDVRSWGKHYLVVFDDFTLRVHFMLFGSYAIDARKENRKPRLTLGFARGRELNFYACSVKYLEGDLDDVYDWSADVMSPEWNPRAARRKLVTHPDMLAADALLHRIRVHPESEIGALPSRKLGEMIREARDYSFDFYEWKKQFVLRQHWQVHAKKYCPRDGSRLSFRKHLGRAARRAFWCDTCQRLYR